MPSTPCSPSFGISSDGKRDCSSRSAAPGAILPFGELADRLLENLLIVGEIEVDSHALASSRSITNRSISDVSSYNVIARASR
jgi:hypothetical protein